MRSVRAVEIFPANDRHTSKKGNGKGPQKGRVAAGSEKRSAVKSLRYLGIARPSCGNRVIPGILFQLYPSVTLAHTLPFFFPPCFQFHFHFFTVHRDWPQGPHAHAKSAWAIAKDTLRTAKQHDRKVTNKRCCYERGRKPKEREGAGVSLRTSDKVKICQ